MPVITAGEPDGGRWCAVCLQPWRLNIPLLLDGEIVSQLELCPGCGTGHDKHATYVTARAPQPRAHLRHRAARAVHARVAARDGKTSPGCAYGLCQWPGLWRHVVRMYDDDGTWRWLFCTARHRSAWAEEHDLPGSLLAKS